jgi:hypothetical protein
MSDVLVLVLEAFILASAQLAACFVHDLAPVAFGLVGAAATAPSGLARLAALARNWVGALLLVIAGIGCRLFGRSRLILGRSLWFGS